MQLCYNVEINNSIYDLLLKRAEDFRNWMQFYLINFTATIMMSQRLHKDVDKSTSKWSTLRKTWVGKVDFQHHASKS